MFIFHAQQGEGPVTYVLSSSEFPLVNLPFVQFSPQPLALLIYCCLTKYPKPTSAKNVIFRNSGHCPGADEQVFTRPALKLQRQQDLGTSWSVLAGVFRTAPWHIANSLKSPGTLANRTPLFVRFRHFILPGGLSLCPLQQTDKLPVQNSPRLPTQGPLDVDKGRKKKMPEVLEAFCGKWLFVTSAAVCWRVGITGSDSINWH